MKLKLKRRYLLLPTLLLGSMLTAACTGNNQVGNNNQTNSTITNTSSADSNSSASDRNKSVGNDQTKLTDGTTGDKDPVDKHNVSSEPTPENKAMDTTKKELSAGSGHMNNNTTQAQPQQKKENMEEAPKQTIGQGTSQHSESSENADQNSKEKTK